MTTAPSTAALDLVQAGASALAAGDSFAARSRFRAATEADPGCAEAWVGLSTVTPVLRDRQSYLRRALELSPGHEAAGRLMAEAEALIARGLHVQKTAPAPARPVAAPAEEEITTTCYRHPERATGLRCGACERPICAGCATNAPVGHLCPECRTRRRPVNYQVGAGQLAVAAGVHAVGGLLAAVLLSFVVVGFLGFYIAVLAGPLVSAGLVMLTDRLTRAKRGRAIQIAAGAATVAGMLPVVLFRSILLVSFQASLGPELLAMMAEANGQTIWTLALASIDPAMVLFAGITAISAMYRLR